MKLFRRLAYIVPILVLLVVPACTSASPRWGNQDDVRKTDRREIKTNAPPSAQAWAESESDAAPQGSCTNCQSDPGPQQAVPWLGPETAPQWILAILAIAGFVVAFCTLTHIRRQADAAQAMLGATRRPKITIRNVVITNLIDLSYVTHGLKGELFATNTGYLPCIVVRTYTRWIFGPLPMENPVHNAENIERDGRDMAMRLESGQVLKLVIEPSGPMTFQEFETLQRKSLYLIGVVKYFDESRSKIWRTVFCRRFDVETRRFVKVDDPDYEYEE